MKDMNSGTTTTKTLALNNKAFSDWLPRDKNILREHLAKPGTIEI